MKAKPYVHDANGPVMGYSIFCPGCRQRHGVRVAPNSEPWSFNGDCEKPTFSPSLLVTTGHYVTGWKDKFPPGADVSCWCTYNAEHPEDTDPFLCGICHSFIVDGKIQFLSDCTHELAGQTVDLPDVD